MSQLRNHEITHVVDPNDKPQWAKKKFCEQCDKWFTDLGSYKSHVKGVSFSLFFFIY